MTRASLEALPTHTELVNIPGFTEQFAARHELAAMKRSIRIVDHVPPDAIVLVTPLSSTD